ncbi:MAG: hemoglobin-like protein [Phycisphaerae bacterium]|nr:hemoglobin-like protein [Phycisphaerae bacterium]|tara:strand:+ start:595 stop:1014 length:420 start_codon:yes stop_codon:yes gene_type:complete
MSTSPQSGDSPFDATNTPWAALGGEDAVRKLADAFYSEMDRNPDYADIRGMHQPDLTSAREKFFEFLSGWLGGPQLYVQRHGHPRLRMRHAPFPIGESQRDQWLSCMQHAMDSCGIDGDIRTFLDARFAHVADFMRNKS